MGAYSDTFTVQLLKDQRKHWSEAADEAGISLSQWIRLICDNAAGIGHLHEQMIRAAKAQNKAILQKNAERARSFRDKKD